MYKRQEELTARENLEYNRALSGQTGDPDAALAALSGCKKLMRLSLYGCDEVSDAAAVALASTA